MLKEKILSQQVQKIHKQNTSRKTTIEYEFLRDGEREQIRFFLNYRKTKKKSYS